MKTHIKKIISGSSFEKDMAYSRAVVDEHYVHVSGTTGFNYADMSISNNVLEQTEQCFENISATLKEAGSDISQVVRIRYLLPKREDFKKCWPVLQKYLSTVKPAATMIVAGLYDERMLIEIEVTARIDRR